MVSYKVDKSRTVKKIIQHLKKLRFKLLGQRDSVANDF